MRRSGSDGEVTLLGCDILHKEISHLIEKNRWPVSCALIPSILHSDFGKLGRALEQTLLSHREREKRVFYGACHPLMERTLKQAATARTPGQNCVEIYLGRELFDRELAGGAFFLFEEWARKWRELSAQAFGAHAEVIREIFAYSHTNILAIRTPCSADFTAEALEVADHVGLELRWLDAGLEHLEATLAQTLDMQTRGGA